MSLQLGTIFLALIILSFFTANFTFENNSKAQNAFEKQTQQRQKFEYASAELPKEQRAKEHNRRVKRENRGGSIHEGLRTDYLMTITLPWTIAMLALILGILICMRTDGWLYHLFTDDYVPPAVKRRMEEEARRAQGKKARMEREDNWNEVRKAWETDFKDRTARIKATMPPAKNY